MREKKLLRNYVLFHAILISAEKSPLGGYMLFALRGTNKTVLFLLLTKKQLNDKIYKFNTLLTP